MNSTVIVSWENTTGRDAPLPVAHSLADTSHDVRDGLPLTCLSSPQDVNLNNEF